MTIIQNIIFCVKIQYVKNLTSNLNVSRLLIRPVPDFHSIWPSKLRGSPLYPSGYGDRFCLTSEVWQNCHKDTSNKRVFSQNLIFEFLFLSSSVVKCHKLSVHSADFSCRLGNKFFKRNFFAEVKD